MARVIDLQEQTEITEDAYILTDNATTGTHKFNLKQLYDDSQRAIASAQSAANSASSAAATAREVAASAQSVASEAESVVDGAAETLATAAERVDAAIDAVGDISELAVPEMSPDVRGGAKLDAGGGLALRDGALGIGTLVQESDGTVRGGIASLTAKGHAEQQSTTGRNLFHINNRTSNGVTFTTTDDGIAINGTSTAAWATAPIIVTGSELASLQEKTLTLSCGNSTSQDFYVNFKEYDGPTKLTEYVVGSAYGTIEPKTFTTVENSTSVRMEVGVRNSGSTVNMVAPAQLELGSTATEYEPYSGGVPSPSPDWPQEIVTVTGHAITGKTGRYVDLEVRQGSTLLSTTHIPLPSRGWVGSLPDGTADVLRLDGAGKVEWELTDAETTTAATDGITGTVGVDVLSTTGQIADGTTVLYKLATPVTEQCGYVDMPSIPGDAHVTIRELDDLGIKYFIDDAVLEYGRQIYERVRNEYADRIERLEQSVAELATA